MIGRQLEVTVWLVIVLLQMARPPSPMLPASWRAVSLRLSVYIHPRTTRVATQ
jgi:hypothetical protein